MTDISKEGMIVNKRITNRRFPGIEQGALTDIKAIVVHQTDSSTAQQTFNAYSQGGHGAHFLIDKTGHIYQTASLNTRCYHVGRYIKSKCLTINKASCNKDSMAKMLALSWSRQVVALDTHERAKNYPARYPVNSDSIGIELVGKSIDDKTYEAVTPQQNASLTWLIGELYNAYKLTDADVYRHPEASYKNPGEASTAEWK